MDWQSYHRIIVGLGKTGLSCVNYFHRLGEYVLVVDDHPQPALLPQLRTSFPEVPFLTGAEADMALQQVDHWVVSPGVALQRLQARIGHSSSRVCEGDVALFCRQAQAPIIAITGSNGKTTVATLMGRIIREAGYSAEVCGNIGEPVLDVLQRPVPDYYVLELSSFQLELLPQLAAHVAIVLNVDPDHMDRYSSFEQYVGVKKSIYSHCTHAVINGDQPQAWEGGVEKGTRFTLREPDAQVFGLSERGGKVMMMHGEHPLIAVDDLRLSGFHHWQNALAVFAMSHCLLLPMEAVCAVLREFEGLPHRCQLVAIRNAVRWVNDSKATNVGAAIAGIQTTKASTGGELLLIVGGIGKGADFSMLAEAVCDGVKQVLVLGEDGPIIAKQLAGHVTLIPVDSLESAVVHAARVAAPGDTVLLSPACASFDMFDNYEHRGQAFSQYIGQLQ